MSMHSCTCPSYEGLSYEEIIEVSALLKGRRASKNCCENAGYICPTLDKALMKARSKRDVSERSSKRNSNGEGFSRGRKLLYKRKLQLRIA